ncbi:MAG: nicotinate phosphoribosyltransferase [Spirochaetes bacterium]|nr:nicotinate phosphoribosyltransferase [Spirochaetota bacterium]
MSVPKSPILTDLYQLTMMQGYRRAGLHRREVCFDYFFRQHPFGGGYTVFAGLSEALQFLAGLRFADDDISYLSTLGMFDNDFLSYLSTMRFHGSVHAMPEGSIIFPHEPVVRIEGPLDEAQMIETALLNILNFQTLIATKAARIVEEAGHDNVLEFGARRAQGIDGALTASRAAYIGGCYATSNVEAGKVYGVPVRGTHAHSWVMAFDTELEAFRTFAELYPNNATFLVDTYDTLKSGVPNAVIVGKEMAVRGQKLVGIRLDSGDFAYLSVEARKMLDAAGLPQVKIVCSGDLDEYIIHDLKAQGAAIDIYGVGTRLASAHGDPSLTGVYKISAMRDDAGTWNMKHKITEGMKKATLPGVKQVWRLYDAANTMMGDVIELDGVNVRPNAPVTAYHPVVDYNKKVYTDVARTEPLLSEVFKDGALTAAQPSINAVRERVRNEMKQLHPTIKRLMNPHIYKVSLGEKLHAQTRLVRGGSAGAEE